MILSCASRHASRQLKMPTLWGTRARVTPSASTLTCWPSPPANAMALARWPWRKAATGSSTKLALWGGREGPSGTVDRRNRAGDRTLCARSRRCRRIYVGSATVLWAPSAACASAGHKLRGRGRSMSRCFRIGRPSKGHGPRRAGSALVLPLTIQLVKHAGQPSMRRAATLDNFTRPLEVVNAPLG